VEIYLVTSGEYSGYRTIAAYSTLEAATKAAELYCADIETYELDPDDANQYPPGMFFYRVDMNRDGDGRVEKLSAQISEHRKREWMPISTGRDEVVFWTWAKDEAHAAKIANERRVQLIANNEWTTDWETWRSRCTK